MKARTMRLLANAPLTSAILLTLAWHVVLFTLAGVLPATHPQWFPDLRPTVVNLGAGALPVGLALWLGLGREAGLDWRRPDRTWWLLIPVLVEALSYLWTGFSATTSVAASATVLYLALGFSEEALSRGLVQHVLAQWGLRRATLAVALLFGGGHVLSGWWFGRPIEDTVFVALNAAAFGYAFAALRWHLGSIWPLALLHGLGDFTQVMSPGNLPFALRVCFLVAYPAYGWYLVGLAERSATPAPGTER